MSVKYITVNEDAEILSIHPRTVTKYLTLRRIKGAKIGRIWRIDEQDVHRFFNESKSLTAEEIEKGEMTYNGKEISMCYLHYE